MMHPTGIGPSSNPIPQALAHQGTVGVPDRAAPKPSVATESMGLRNHAQSTPSAAMSTQAQLAQRGVPSSAASTGTGASPSSQEQGGGASQSQSASGQAKQSGEGFSQFMKILQSVGQSLAQIGQMVMDGIGKGLNMATSLISSVAGIAKSILPM